ncbi:MAG: hypothetical protein AB1742_12560, partial [bacterium]
VLRPKKSGDAPTWLYVSFEAGRMRDSSVPDAISRAVGKLYLDHRLAAGGTAQVSFVADCRGALYSGSRRYGAAGAGLRLGATHGKEHSLSVQYMHFDQGGTSRLYYDRIDPDDKLFMISRIGFGGGFSLTLDTQYDLDQRIFDEIEYKLTREFNCIRASIGWRTERREFLFGMKVTNFGRKTR